MPDIISKTSVDNRQLNIITGLNFFSDYGCNKKLLDIIKLYDQFGSCKIIKKNKLEELHIDEEVIRQFAGKETAKQYAQIDNIGLINALSKRIEDKPLSIKEQIKFEQEYLESILYTNAKAPKGMYYVVECKFYKDKTKPYLRLYNIKTGEYLKTKITSGKSFIESPFGEGNVINVAKMDERNKRKKIGGEWKIINEKEKVVVKWDVY